MGVRPYRGVPAVAHSGADAGYRAYFMRLPQQKLAVIVLGDASDFNARDIASKVADLYLDGSPGVQPHKAWPREVELQTATWRPTRATTKCAPAAC